VDHARSRQRQKRGGDRVRVSLEDFTPLSVSNDFDVLVVNDLLERLATLSERQARVVEMRFFGGLTMNEVADVLGVSLRTANGDWAVARAWMRRELTQ
ncbi:MAG: RNA polymerase subunit sigma-24, partial [Myxococcales bacterium]|nr:RNA polymerase subunit sigma-24 [Myxococcales bacterium]